MGDRGTRGGRRLLANGSMATAPVKCPQFGEIWIMVSPTEVQSARPVALKIRVSGLPADLPGPTPKLHRAERFLSGSKREPCEYFCGCNL